MKKISVLIRMVAFTLAVCLSFAFAPMMSVAQETEAQESAVSVWDGTSVSTSLATDSDGAYLIQSAADLAYFQSLLQNLGSTSAGLQGNVYKLTTDIVWNEGDAADWAAQAPANTWSTIGKNSYNSRFAGTIDGQGHTIYGLYVNNQDAGGLISYGGAGLSIRNLSIQNSYIVTNKRASAFVGAHRNGACVIENVYTDAIISCTGDDAGGIVGQINNASGVSVTVRNAVFNGSISGTSNVGGIIAGAAAAATYPVVVIENSANLGSVEGTAAAVGGIMGRGGKTTQSISITNCISLGSVSASAGVPVAGLLAVHTGNTLVVEDNIYNSDLSATSGTTVAVPADANTALSAAEIRALTNSELDELGFTNWVSVVHEGIRTPLPASVAGILDLLVVSADAIINATVTLNGQADAAKAVALMQNGEIIAIKVSDQNGTVSFSVEDLAVGGVYVYSVKQINQANNNGYTYDLAEKVITVTVDDEGNVTVTGNSVIANGYSTENLPSVWDGTVSEELEQDADGAYLIQSAADLALFQQWVQGISSHSGLGGLVFKLTTDIVWNDGNAAYWGEEAPANEWSTLTTSSTANYNCLFKETFDGQGHTISGLYVNSANAGGFIAYAGSGATIRNLAIVNSYISVAQRGGAFIGAARTGACTLENVYSDAIIVSSGVDAGGFVGQVNNVAGMSVSVKNAVFSGSVSGTTRVGGIVAGTIGNNPSFVFENVVNLGDVAGTDIVGGIVAANKGNTLTVTNCINLGSVVAPEGARAGALFAVYTGTSLVLEDNIYNSDCLPYGETTHTVPSDANTALTANEIAALTPATLPESFTAAQWAVGTVKGENIIVPASVELAFTPYVEPAPAPEPDVYDPELEHKFIVTDSVNRSILVYDLNLCNGDFSKLAGDDAIVWEWKWNEDPNSTHPSGYRWGLDSAKYRYSPYYDKDVVIACASSGWVGIIDYATCTVLWEDDLGRGPHSVEMLPNGDLIVAVATQGAHRLVYYSLSAGITDPVHEVEGASPHGVSWDPKNNCIWSLEMTGVVRINIEDAGTANARMVRVPGAGAGFVDPFSGGHAFAPVGGESGKYWASNNGDLQIFDAETRTLSNSYDNYQVATAGGIKGICSFADGTIIQAVINVGGSTTLEVSDGFRIITRERSAEDNSVIEEVVTIVPISERGFYKVQAFSPIYQ